jgi:hypothetical protein
MHRVLPPSEPPDGERPRFFCLVIIGGTQLRGSWYLSVIARLQGFSSGSPAASPCRWSPKTVTTSLMVGRSKPCCGLCPALSFKDLHHPCWGGGRAKPGPAFAWAGVSLLPLDSGGGNHPPALRRRRPPAMPEWAAASHLGFCRPAGPPMWGVVRTCGVNRSSVCNGTLSAGVCSLWLSGPEHRCNWA